MFQKMIMKCDHLKIIATIFEYRIYEKQLYSLSHVSVTINCLIITVVTKQSCVSVAVYG